MWTPWKKAISIAGSLINQTRCRAEVRTHVASVCVRNRGRRIPWVSLRKLEISRRVTMRNQIVTGCSLWKDVLQYSKRFFSTCSEASCFSRPWARALPRCSYSLGPFRVKRHLPALPLYNRGPHGVKYFGLVVQRDLSVHCPLIFV